MPLPEPTLDNRRYDQLVGEGRALIPRLAPAWTDQNASDPGITLIELGGWLAEQNIYRFDRLSDEAARAFVRLVGIEPRMPTPAATVVCLGGGAGTAVAAGLQLGTPDQALFETGEAVFASAAVRVAVRTGTDPFVDASADNDARVPFAAFGPAPRAGRALQLGFDRALDAAGATLSLHVWTTAWIADAATRSALQAEQAAAAAALPGGCAPPDWRRHYRVTTVWEFQAGGGAWQALADVVDETRGLSLSGFVRFSAPVGHAADAAGRFWIRCRIVAGRFECPPWLLHVAFNAVSCAHAVSMAAEPLGRARGHAQARFSTTRSPVVAGSVALRADDGAGDDQTDWTTAPDFDRTGAFDRVAVLNPERGELISGDGLRAAILPAGHDLFAAYRVGGGEAGNVGADTLVAAPANPHNLALLAPAALAALAVTQPFAAQGGAPRETLESAQARAFDAACAVDKAVTVDDIERLAKATPGVPVARVRAVPNLSSMLPCYPAPSLVSVIVIPPCPRRAPRPSRALLAAVERYLAPRRLVTSEIHAIAPHYRRVAVQATLHLQCDALAAPVAAAARAALDAFLDPLTGGPDGTGWPFGRSVYRTEVMALLADVPGVARVTALQLMSGASAGAAAGAGADAGSCGCGCGGTSGTSGAGGCGCGGNGNTAAAVDVNAGGTGGCASAGGGGCQGGCAGSPAPTAGGCGCTPRGGAFFGALGRCDNVDLCAHELVLAGRHALTIESDIPSDLRRSKPHECDPD